MAKLCPEMMIIQALDQGLPIIWNMEIDGLGMGQPEKAPGLRLSNQRERQFGKNSQSCVIDVKNAAQFSLNRHYLEQQIEERKTTSLFSSSPSQWIAYRGYLRTVEDQRIDNLNAVIRFLVGINGRTSQPDKPEAQSLFMPFLWVINLSLDTGLDHTIVPLILPPDGCKQWVSPAIELPQTIVLQEDPHKIFPYNKIRFAVYTNNPAISHEFSQAVAGGRKTRMIATIDETKLRHKMHRVGYDLERPLFNTLEIPITITHPSQIVPFGSYSHT